MKRLLLVLLLAFAGSASAQPPEEWQQAARVIPYLNPGMIFYDRSPEFRYEQTYLSPEEREAMLKIWEFSTSTPADSLWALADDPDPKISTMALAAAWLQGDPHRLPEFAKRTK